MIRLWEIRQAFAAKPCKGIRLGHLTQLSPNGQTLASGGEDGSVVCGTECFKLLQGHSSCVWEVAFNPAGQTLASGSADRSARLWNVQGGTCLKTFQGRTNGFVQSALVRWLHAGQWQSRCPPAALGLAARNLFKALPGHTSWIWAVHFIRMVKWLRVAAVIKPCGSGMCDGISAAKHCRDIRVWFARQFQPHTKQQ